METENKNKAWFSHGCDLLCQALQHKSLHLITEQASTKKIKKFKQNLKQLLDVDNEQARKLEVCWKHVML